MPFVSSIRGTFGPASENKGVVSGSQLAEILRQDPNGSGLPSGGTITTAGGYRIHTFTDTGTTSFNLNSISSLDVEYLVIAGGGGGGDFFGGPGYNMAAGGGGAGGYRTGSLLGIDSPRAVQVGAGGVSTATGPGQSNALYSKPGQNSGFDTIVSNGGGRGTAGNTGSDAAGPNAYNADPGGSGGGGGRGDPTPIIVITANGGLGTPGQGNRGGNGPNNNAAGGGGAGGIGGTATQSLGGAGLSSSITGSAVARAGGGGGGQGWIPDGPHSGAGGSGVGGNGGKKGTTPSTYPLAYGTDGSQSTGSGGGGAGSYPDATKSPGTFFNGGDGADGIVVVRYLI